MTRRCVDCSTILYMYMEHTPLYRCMKLCKPVHYYYLCLFQVYVHVCTVHVQCIQLYVCVLYMNTCVCMYVHSVCNVLERYMYTCRVHVLALCMFVFPLLPCVCVLSGPRHRLHQAGGRERSLCLCWFRWICTTLRLKVHHVHMYMYMYII